MYWLLLIVITGVVTMLITVAFGWRVFVAVRGLVRELKKSAEVLNQATALLSSAQEMDGVKALRTRAQHD